MYNRILEMIVISKIYGPYYLKFNKKQSKSKLIPLQSMKFGLNAK